MIMNRYLKITAIALAIGAMPFISCSKDEDGGTGTGTETGKATYTVTFDADGGSPVPAVQRIEEGGTATIPATNPSKTGYTFLFWCLSGASTAYDFTAPVKSNITLQAKWEIVEAARLSVSPDSPITFTETGGAYDITVTTNQSSWDAVSDQTWCTVEKSEDQFTVTASANTASTERKATITVTAGNATNVTINATQAAAAPVSDNLARVCYNLAYTIRITEMYKKGQKPGYIENAQGKTLVYVAYNPNSSLNYLNIVHNVNSTVWFSYSTPIVMCFSTALDKVSNASAAFLGGTYNYADDPARVEACFGSFPSSSVFTSLSNLRLMANNSGITEEVYNTITFPGYTYKLIVFAERNGKKYGRYVGYSTTAGDRFVYWNIDPDDADFGKISSRAIP
jgi:uncharacterized repeat protein (TIGR02543 family)